MCLHWLIIYPFAPKSVLEPWLFCKQLHPSITALASAECVP